MARFCAVTAVLRVTTDGRDVLSNGQVFNKLARRDSVAGSTNFYCMAATQFGNKFEKYQNRIGFSDWLEMFSLAERRSETKCRDSVMGEREACSLRIRDREAEIDEAFTNRRNSVATLPTFAEIPFWWRSFCSPMVHRPKLLCWDKRL